VAVLVLVVPGLFRLAPWWLRVEPASGRAVLLIPITVGVGLAAFVAGACIAPLVGLIVLD
jgi:hypothetical protein